MLIDREKELERDGPDCVSGQSPLSAKRKLQARDRESQIRSLRLLSGIWERAGEGISYTLPAGDRGIPALGCVPCQLLLR